MWSEPYCSPAEASALLDTNAGWFLQRGHQVDSSVSEKSRINEVLMLQGIVG